MVKRKRKNIVRKRITMKMFCKEAEDSMGNLTKIANNLGTTLTTLKKWIKDHPSSAQIIGDAQWKAIDICENKLHKMALTDKYNPALQFKALKLILQAKAKDRGYTSNLLQVNTQNNYYEEIKEDVLSVNNDIKKILEDK